MDSTKKLQIIKNWTYHVHIVEMGGDVYRVYMQTIEDWSASTEVTGTFDNAVDEAYDIVRQSIANFWLIKSRDNR